MTQRRGPLKISDSLSKMPGAIIAFVGFGIFLLSVEGTRLPAIQTVGLTRSPGILSSIIAFFTLLALALIFRKHLDALKLRSAFVILVGILMSVSLFSTIGAGFFDDNLVVRNLSRILSVISEGALFFCWVKTLYPCGPRLMALCFAFSLIVLAVLSSATALFRTEAAHGVVTMLPILSAACLCYYREYVKTRIVLSEGDSSSMPAADPNGSLFLPSDNTQSGHRTTVVMLVLSLFCYAFVFGYIHFGWLALQDGGIFSIAMQLSTALGSGIAGLITLCFVLFLWSRRNLELYKLFLIPTIIFALWLSTFVNEGWVMLYLVLLNITQKLVFLLIILAPFVVRSEISSIWPWCLAYLGFAGGRSVSSVIINAFSLDVFATMSVIALAILFVCAAISIFRVNEAGNIMVRLSSNSSSSDGKLSDAPGYKFKKACRSLSSKYQLTQREEEVLILLARGRTAQHIAENMVITPSTAKTHLRNIYSKLNVHNQQEVINLVEKKLTEQRELDDNSLIQIDV